jgi:hypothetical protein
MWFATANLVSDRDREVWVAASARDQGKLWVNGKLAGTRIWPPYAVDISKHVKPGENRLDVVAANLLANRMSWDIFDDAKGEAVNRKWHDGNIRRDAWSLESGLLGPVRLFLKP